MRLGVLTGIALALAACGGSGETEPDPASTPAVYAAVIRMFVTGSDLVSPLGPVFVDDGDLTVAQQAAVKRRLADLPPVEFVAERRSVLVDVDECPSVKDDGVLITLGAIAGGSDRVTVHGDLFAACLGALTAVWILEREGDEWRVTGSEGPVGVS